jgi:Galactose oxidase, central domain
MYVFGGRTEEGTDLGDLAAFRISSKRWYTFQNMGPSPSPRSGHSMTAHGKQIVVLAGEPSSAPRDPGELSMVYVLDTGKIRYPNDAPQGSDTKQPASPTRRPSTEVKNQFPPKRSQSREGQDPVTHAPITGYSRSTESPLGGSVQRPEIGAHNPNSRLPRASVAQAPAGPPPQGQPPNPRANGVASPANGMRAPQLGQRPLQEVMMQAPAVKELQKENTRPGRDVSPGAQGRRTSTEKVQAKAKAMDAGEALGRSSSAKHHSDGHASVRSIIDEPKSPKLNAHQEALVKELETSKRTNAWYASELALAKKAGYLSASSSSPTFDDRAVNQFSDDDKPLIEAFMTMRSEMMKMQQAMEQQSSGTARRIAEVEHQRDAAVTEAAYARAKLAAHGGSQRSTPQPDAIDESDRSTDISRRLALALAASGEHKSKFDHLTNELNAERRAREAAEEAAEAAQRRLEDSSHGRNPAETEGLRADLHEAQAVARSESTLRAEAEEKLRMLRLDHDAMSQKHEGTSSRLKDHLTSIAALYEPRRPLRKTD